MSGSSNFLSDIGRKLFIGGRQLTIEKIIAEGGYGVVFLVRDGGGHKLALKRLYVNDIARLEECKLEIEILISLSGYPHVIKYVGSSINHLQNGVDEILILTQYYPVTCMQLQKEKGVFSQGQVMRIFCDMCEAVSVLHHCQVPIIHRDIKLENILMDHQYNSVLCDFGSATKKSYVKGKHNKTPRELEEEFHQHTTPTHRAPEIVDLYSDQSITTKIDIWALGVSLYRLCFNSLPFGESTLAIQNGHFNIPEDSVYSETIHALIYYCLEVDPDQRPDIYQVSCVANQLCGKTYSAKRNINNSTAPSITQVVNAMKVRQSQTIKRCPSPRVTIDRSEWVETTTVIPRERPKPGRQLQHASKISSNGSHYSGQGHRQPNSQGNPDILSKVTTPHHQRVNANNLISHQLPVSSVNPFGDDFGKYNLVSSHSTSTPHLTITQPPHHQPSVHQPSFHQPGFEDSFLDVSRQPGSLLATSNTQIASNPLFLNVEATEHVRGHRRYKSDTTSMLGSSALKQPVQTHSTNPFSDDFSRLSYGQLAEQTNSLSINSKRHYPTTSGQQLDEFGSIPFNSVNPNRHSKTPSQ